MCISPQPCHIIIIAFFFLRVKSYLIDDCDIVQDLFPVNSR